MHIKLTICLLLMLLACSSCQSQEIYEPLFKCTKKLQASYGICTHINRKGPRYEFDTREQDLSMVDSTRATWLRADWDWPTLRVKGQDELSFSLFDQMMESVNAHKKSIFGILSLDGKYKMSEIDKWKSYVSQTVEHYKRSVCHWEIVNEVDIIQQWTPGIYAKDYVELLKTGYAAIKSQDKRAKVLFSGISNTDLAFLDSVLGKDVSVFFDIMTVHHYTKINREPEEFLSYFMRLKKKLSKYRINKPVWLTETGGSTMPGQIDEQTQAISLPRIFLISFASGMDKVFWYKSRSREMDPEDGNDFYGLWHYDYTPKPAFYTYQTLVKMCPDKSTRPKLVREGNVYIASWKRPDRMRTWALWTSKKDETINLDINGKCKVYNDRGEEILGEDFSEMRITPSVIYIIGAKDVSLR